MKNRVTLRDVEKCVSLKNLDSLMRRDDAHFMSKKETLGLKRYSCGYPDSIYFLFTNNILSYIGHTGNIARRCYQHCRTKDFDFVVFFFVDECMELMEKTIIHTFKTMYNRCKISENAVSLYNLPPELGFKKALKSGNETWGSYWEGQSFENIKTLKSWKK